MKSNNLNFSANPQINLEIQNFAFSEKIACQDAFFKLYESKLSTNYFFGQAELRYAT